MGKIKVLFLLVICLTVCSAGRAQTSEKIVAVVGKDVITQSELEESLRPMYKQYSTLFAGDELEEKCKKAKEETLNQMVKDKLILQEARRQEITVEDTAIEEKLKEMISKFPSEEKFLEALGNEGISLDLLREKYREQLIIRKLTNMEVRAKVALGPQDVLDYYNAHPEEFTEPEQVKASTILIRVREDDDGEITKGRIAEIEKLLAEGMDFGRLALVSSEGPEAQNRGDMGFIEKGQLLEEVDKVIFALNPGEVSKPLRTKIGYHIFKVEAKKQARIKDFKEVSTQIEDKLFQQKAVARFNEWLEKLKENVYINIK